MSTALEDVLAERARQDAKWGEQNHPDGTGPETRPLLPHLRINALPPHAHARDLADAFTSSTNDHAAADNVTWTDILLEEVFEALAEDDETKLRTELVQVAAVAAQWVEAIDRRTV